MLVCEAIRLMVSTTSLMLLAEAVSCAPISAAAFTCCATSPELRTVSSSTSLALSVICEVCSEVVSAISATRFAASTRAVISEAILITL